MPVHPIFIPIFLSRYLEEALEHLLSCAQASGDCVIGICTRNIFKGKLLIDIAGEAKCDTVLIHILIKRSIDARWNVSSCMDTYR